LGTAVTWPLTGIITEIYGWKWAFYIAAIVTAIVAILWFYAIADCPEKHKTISKDERSFIEKSLEVTFSTKRDFPPISQMAKSMPLHALVWLHFGEVWGVFFLLTSAPMFMTHVLKFDLKNAGLLSSLPYISRLIFGFLFGMTGDIIRSRNILSVTQIRKIFCIFCKL
jgi:ACS family sodium-dependent inorganic phosphate cotransporter